jgi:hypothetical protein
MFSGDSLAVVVQREREMTGGMRVGRSRATSIFGAYALEKFLSPHTLPTIHGTNKIPLSMRVLKLSHSSYSKSTYSAECNYCTIASDESTGKTPVRIEQLIVIYKLIYYAVRYSVGAPVLHRLEHILLAETPILPLPTRMQTVTPVLDLH